MIMIIRFCSVCAEYFYVLQILRFWIEMSFLTWQLVSIWIIFSVGRWYYLFLLHAYKVSKLNAIQHGFLPREGYGRRLQYLLITNYDLSNACHTLGLPIQANPTTNPSKPNDQSKQTQRPIQGWPMANPTMANPKMANPTTANPNDGPPESKHQGQNTMYGLPL